MLTWQLSFKQLTVEVHVIPFDAHSGQIQGPSLGHQQQSAGPQRKLVSAGHTILFVMLSEVSLGYS